MKDYISEAIEKIVKSIDCSDSSESADAVRLSQAALNLTHLQLNINNDDSERMAEVEINYNVLLKSAWRQRHGVDTAHETALRLIDAAVSHGY